MQTGADVVRSTYLNILNRWRWERVLEYGPKETDIFTILIKSLLGSCFSHIFNLHVLSCLHNFGLTCISVFYEPHFYSTWQLKISHNDAENCSKQNVSKILMSACGVKTLGVTPNAHKNSQKKYLNAETVGISFDFLNQCRHCTATSWYAIQTSHI